ncbi:MAG: transketolase family protein [Endomicrobiia bacterium]
MVQTFGSKATRYGYGEGLVELGEKNPNVVAIGLDITTSTTVNLFKERFPDRFISLGIAEQNGMGVAAGLSLVGKIPYICTYGVFAAGRCWDQIRTTVCYSNCNVKIGGGHGGISVGPDGATHQALEEIATMRVVPNMKVIVPCDYVETKKATIAAAEIFGPVYIRFGREPTPIITDEKTPFIFGKANVLRDGNDVAIIGCGPILYEALSASEILEKKGIKARVINIHTVKPIDEEIIIKAAKECGAIVTVEEHQVMGGFGSAVAEVVVKNYPIPMEFIGIFDKFGESGQPEELWRKYKLKDVNIVEAVEKVLKRK